MSNNITFLTFEEFTFKRLPILSIFIDNIKYEIEIDLKPISLFANHSEYKPWFQNNTYFLPGPPPGATCSSVVVVVGGDVVVVVVVLIVSLIVGEMPAVVDSSPLPENIYLMG